MELNSQQLFDNIVNEVEKYTLSHPIAKKYIDNFKNSWNNCDSIYSKVDLIFSTLLIGDTI